MGKGTILGGGSGGQYSVEVELDTSRIQTEIARLSFRIAQVESMMADMEEGRRKSYYRILLTSLQKKKSYLENHKPENPILPAWCADLTENLTGTVGTIEVPGERGTVLIQPGHNGNAAYSSGRDGILAPGSSLSPAGAFYNLAMKPGWQKWKPTYRFGTITAIQDDTCSVSLEGASNSETGLGVNQSGSLSGVPISYMQCNGTVFEEGDEVIVEFQGQDWNNPRVIGFRENPKPCCPIYETFENNEFHCCQWVVTWNESYWPHDPEYWFEDEVLHFHLGEFERVEIHFSAGSFPKFVKDYPVLRWNIDCNYSGQGIDYGRSGVVVVMNVQREDGIGKHFFVIWYNAGWEGFIWPEYHQTAEPVERGVKEINLLDRFAEMDKILGIYIYLVNSDVVPDILEGSLGFFTLCPK